MVSCIFYSLIWLHVLEIKRLRTHLNNLLQFIPLLFQEIIHILNFDFVFLFFLLDYFVQYIDSIIFIFGVKFIVSNLPSILLKLGLQILFYVIRMCISFTLKFKCFLLKFRLLLVRFYLNENRLFELSYLNGSFKINCLVIANFQLLYSLFDFGIAFYCIFHFFYLLVYIIQFVITKSSYFVKIFL